MNARNNQIEQDKNIYCDKLNSLSSFNDKILFKKHTHKINHIDLLKNLLMTSGDDDLIIIIDLQMLKYALTYYDIINGTRYSKFLEPSSQKIIYYGYKSYKLYIYDYLKDQILYVVNLLRENLYHFEYNIKSNIVITTQEKNNVVWKLNEIKLLPYYNIKDSYYAIINENKQHIISCSKIYKNNDSSKKYSAISIYIYDNNTRNFLVKKDRDLNRDFGFHINMMSFYKNYENYNLILMSDFEIEMINLDNNDSKICLINLRNSSDLKFTCIEPVFTKEILVGYNNGDVELINPFWEEDKIKKNILRKYDEDRQIMKIIRQIEDNDVRHQNSVVQIKMSDYYPLYVSISDEMIIYQLKDN